MSRGEIFALLIATTALVGCVATPGRVDIRPIADPAAALSRGGDDLTVARGQLALGNVGLALEAFREVRRARPSDPAPLAGIGDCYAAMGRLDLARANYEAALALAPKSPRLLDGLAQILERKGEHARALAVRAEAVVIAMPVTLAPAAVLATALPLATAVAARVDAPAPVSSSITVRLPPVRAVPRLEVDGAAVTPDATDPTGDTGKVVLSPPRTGGSLPSAGRLARLLVDAAAMVAGPPSMDGAPPSSSVSVALPPVRPVPVRSDKHAASQHAGPRLERLSLGEVALVTSSKPLWRANLLARTASSGSVRWMPLAPTGARPNVQVLNAARVQGLAASARTVLVNRGWRKIAIGDAAYAQEQSIVLYPRDRAGLARSLAAQFGIGSRMVEGDVLVLVLGRDKAGEIRGLRG
jgi:hypothetical protein